MLSITGHQCRHMFALINQDAICRSHVQGATNSLSPETAPAAMLMREVDAFSYWPENASALSGFGGERRSPDPCYCFHTQYHEVQPGPARYVFRLNGVRATRGELQVRVHCYREPNNALVSLVSSTRMPMERCGDAGSVEVRFQAMRGVRYAFYGYFTEDSDISADHVAVELWETEGGDDSYVEPPRSALAMNEVEREVRPANALIHAGGVSLKHPVSQDCTIAQLRELERADTGDREAALQAWRETVCVNALWTYGVHVTGLEGWLVGLVSSAARAQIASARFVLRDFKQAAAPDVRQEGFADFLLWPEGPDLEGTATQRWEQIASWIACLKIGGFAAIGLRYQLDDEMISATQAVSAAHLSRNEIGRWALRLVGQGCSVAPLAFRPRNELILDDQGIVNSVFLVERL